MNRKILSILTLLLLTATVFAQKEAPKDWFLLDPKADKIYGAGIEEAYETLGDRPSETVIVAVIDSGVEVDHEDLKGKIWVNDGEIPGNGIDDDNNGYVDDINGWNFIGGEGGEIDGEASELSRIYYQLAPTYAHLDAASKPDNMEEFKYFKEMEKAFISEMNDHYSQFQTMRIISKYIQDVESETGMIFSKKANKLYEPKDDMEIGVQEQIYFFFPEMDGSLEEIKKELTEGAEHFGKMLHNNQMNVDSVRRAVVGDDPDDITERYYGCNRVEGPDALHGTHVSGIIAGNRNNNLGIRGEVDNVRIMVLRAVPDGDERDKDIANSILYAVDNGASIINMSFGKYYSPHKGIIDEAVRYAASKDVLIVHAAGNDANNSDVKPSFPNRIFEGKVEASNWIEVGASSYKKGKTMPAEFSNYGKHHVDLFGPGVDMYSTVIDNKYVLESGTSMACPSVAGVAALVRSYFPELSAAEVREVLMKTVVPYKKKVWKPGGTMVKTKNGEKYKDVKVRFTDLCSSGGIVNANNAVKYLLEK